MEPQCLLKFCQMHELSGYCKLPEKVAIFCPSTDILRYSTDLLPATYTYAIQTKAFKQMQGMIAKGTLL